MSSYARALIVLGKRIQERRESLGLTRTQVGDAVGVTKSAVRKWELGLSPPHHKHVQVLARVLKMGVGELNPFAEQISV